MPSPFPGMDPYLEDPAIWPDLHATLATTISAALNRVLPRPYYARQDSRPEIGIVGDDDGRPIVPDVTVIRPLNRTADREPRRPESGGTATLERTQRSAPSASMRIGLTGEPVRHRYVEIRDPTHGHALVTLFEIVNPSNKRPGSDRTAYLAKQQEVIDSEANLVEIDWLAAGRPVVATPSVLAALRNGGESRRYIVAVSRAWERWSPRTEYEVYPFGLEETLPCISVPLREGEPEILLDLQCVFDGAYDSGPYDRGAVDYAEPPAAPLTDAERAWLRGRVTAAYGEPAPNPEVSPPLPGERG